MQELRAALSTNPLWREWERLDPGGGVPPDSDRLRHVGLVKEPGGARGRYYAPDDWPELCDQLPDMTLYHYPERSPEEERRILVELVKHQRNGETPEAHSLLNQAQQIMSDSVPHCLPPLWLEEWRLPTPREFLDASLEVVEDANPGFPSCYLGATKGDVLFDHFSDLYHLVCVRILAITYVSDYVQDPCVLVSCGAASPIKVEIKKELIKIGKLPRLILLVDLSNDILERLCYGPYNFVMKQMWGKTWSAIGMGFSAHDSIRLLGPLGGALMTSDVPKFDSTETAEEDVLCAELVADSYDFSTNHPGRRFMRRLEVTFAWGVYVFSDGVVWCQVVRGMRKTGRRQTSRFNTENRARRAIAVGIKGGTTPLVLSGDGRGRKRGLDPNIKAAGDDCTETHFPGVEDVYASLNFPLRDAEETVREGLTFCSHTWKYGVRPVGQRIAKSAAKVLHASAEVQVVSFCSFIQEYDNHPDFRMYATVILGARPQINTVYKF